MKPTAAQLDIAELTAALAEARKANQRLRNDLQRQSELIAALRNEIATKEEMISKVDDSYLAALNCTAQLEAQVKLLADTLQLSGLSAMDAVKAQMAAEADGRTYSDGCGL